jgi:integrase/recombinase XerD
MTFTELIEPFLAYSLTERQIQTSTAMKYRELFSKWIEPWSRGRSISSVTKRDVGQLRSSMHEVGLSLSRIAGVLAVTKGMLRYARQLLGMECMDPGDIELPSRGAPHVVYLTELELQRVLGAIPVHTFAGARLRAFIEVLLATGMRLSEALSLDREPFDAQASEVEIVGKGQRRRTVFFNRRCIYWTRLYLSKRFDSHAALFVTTGLNAERWRREDISRFFINLRGKARLSKKLTPHVLRHTYCTNLRNRGVDISLIKELAGHSDIGTTARYYLGTDKNVLRKTAAQFVHYDAGSVES